MNRLSLLSVAGVALAGAMLTGCASATDKGSTAAPSATAGTARPTPSAAPSPTAKAEPTPSRSRGGSSLPDICTLLSNAEVESLTGRQVTLRTDEGGGSENTRYCQWQLSAGQLTITVTNETREQFDVMNAQAKRVDGVGESAYSLSGHLFVFADGRQVDVYASSADAVSTNLTVERRAAVKVLPRLAG